MSAPNAPDPRQWQESERWLARAEEDLRVADALLAITPPAIGAAAFHCQQAAEKMAKAVLIAVREPPPKLHDIAELGRRITPRAPDIGRAIESLRGITRWYASARYPDASLESDPSADDGAGRVEPTARPAANHSEPGAVMQGGLNPANAASNHARVAGV